MKNTFFKLLTLLTTGAFISILSSFASPAGGDVFEVYLNQKLVFQQFVHMDKKIKDLSIGTANYNDELRIKYSHCGKTGNERKLALKDNKDKVIKQWLYKNGEKTSMKLPVKELLDVQKGSQGSNLKLVYSSRELPAGMELVSINFAGIKTAKL